MFHLNYSLIYIILIITMASTNDPTTLKKLRAPNNSPELMTTDASTDDTTSTTQTSTNLTVNAATKKPIIIQEATFEQVIPDVIVNGPNEISEEDEYPQQSNTQPQYLQQSNTQPQYPLQYPQQSNTQLQYPLQYPQQSNTQPQYLLQYPQNPYSSQYNPYLYYSAPQYQFAQYPLQAAVPQYPQYPQYPAIQYPPPVNSVPQYQPLPQEEPKANYLVKSPLTSLVQAFNELLSFVENSDSITPKLNVGIENLLPGDLKEFNGAMTSPISGRSLPSQNGISHNESKELKKKYVDKENKEGYPVTMLDKETKHSSHKRVRNHEENEQSSFKRYQRDENFLFTHLKPGQTLHKHTYYSIEESKPSFSSKEKQPLKLPYNNFYIPNSTDQQKFVIL